MSEVSQETMMFKREPEKLNVAETIKKYMLPWKRRAIILWTSWQAIC